MSLLSKSIKPQFSSIRRTLSQLFDLLASAEIIKKKKKRDPKPIRSQHFSNTSAVD